MKTYTTNKETPFTLVLMLVFLCSAMLSCKTGTAGVPAKKFMNLDDKPLPGYTHVVTATPGKTIYLSGMGGSAADGTMPKDFHTQADNTFKNIGRALKMAGADFKDIVKINYFVSDIGNLQELRSIRSGYLNMQAPPASTLVQAVLVSDLLVEIECVAVVSESGK